MCVSKNSLTAEKIFCMLIFSYLEKETEMQSVQGVYFLKKIANEKLATIRFKRMISAQLTCILVPFQCPFDRTFDLVFCKISIPPLCKINPLYDGVIALKVSALKFLEERNIDTAKYQ